MPFLSFAQKVLGEGTVMYRATLNRPDGTKAEGIYSITVKNKQVRKELKIGADFENVQILDNEGKMYSLRSMSDKHFAVEMSKDDFTAKNGKYYEPQIKDGTDSKQVAGMMAQKAVLVYKDGSNAELYYTKDWKPEMDFTFERFHGLEGFPLIFTYKNEQGAVISFEATKIDEGVVENGKFKIPGGYKIITNEEYKKLKTN